MLTSNRVLTTVNGTVAIPATPRAQAPISSDTCGGGGASVLNINKQQRYHHCHYNSDHLHLFDLIFIQLQHC